MNVKSYELNANQYFALIDGPFDKKQHQNQQKGLDVYVRVLNMDSGEECVKKLYENKKGLHFKHSGYPPSYLSEMTIGVIYIPYQVIGR